MPPVSPSTLIQRLPRHLKMGELRIFVAVLEHRSFRKAAAVLHLSQPAITKAIAGLEQTLGVRLFDRIANGVEPTPHGASFAPRAAAIFDELRRAAQDLALLSSGAVGSLRMGTVPLPALPFVPLALNRLLDAHPGIQVSMVEARETELIDRLRKRDIEVAIMRLSLVEPPDDTRLIKLFDKRLCVVAAADHPLARRRNLKWPELMAQRWVLSPADFSFYLYVQRTLAKAGLQMPTHAVEAMSIQLQFNLIMHAGMLGFGLRSQLDFAPGKGSVVRLPVELPADASGVCAVLRAAHQTCPLALQLIDHIGDLVDEQSTPRRAETLTAAD